MKLLIVKTSSLGDVVHCLPAVTDALNAIPELQIDWLVEEGFSEIPRWHSGVNKVIKVAVRRWRKTPFSQAVRQEIQSVKQQLASAKYDLVIDAQGLMKSAWMARWAKAPVYGYDRQSIRESLASLFNSHSFRISRELHAVLRVRELFSKALGYPFDPEVIDYGLKTFLPATTYYSDSKYIVFSHSTTWQSKHLPEQYWVDLAVGFKEKGVDILLPWVNEVEKARAQRIIEQACHGTLLPKMPLTEVAKVINSASAVVSVDTGLAHITAALDIPLITVFGSTNPGLVKPVGKRVKIFQANYSCSPCSRTVCKFKDESSEIYPPCYQSILVSDLLKEIE